MNRSALNLCLPACVAEPPKRLTEPSALPLAWCQTFLLHICAALQAAVFTTKYNAIQLIHIRQTATLSH